MIAKMFRSSSVRVIVVRTRWILIFRIQNTCTSQDVVTLDIFMKASFYGVTLCFLLAFFTTYWVILIDTHCACDIYHRGGSRFSKGGAQVSIPPPPLKVVVGGGGVDWRAQNGKKRSFSLNVLLKIYNCCMILVLDIKEKFIYFIFIIPQWPGWFYVT